MFKKLTVILIAVLYLSVSTGFTVNAHYCFGVLDSVSLTSTPCCCGNEVKYHCCKTTRIHVSLKDSYKLPVSNLTVLSPVLLPAPVSYGLSVLLAEESIQQVILIAAPPDLYQPPIHLLNRNLRI